MVKLLFLILTLISCGTEGSRPVNVPEQIAIRADTYRSLIHQVQDADGFIDTKRCDSLLFSSLAGTAGVNIDIEAAQLSPGEWIRRPKSYPECYDNGLSRSRISRDMLLGVMWYAYTYKRLDLLKEMWRYGVANNWVMGEYRGLDAKAFGTMLMNPAYITLLAKLIKHLGGPVYAPAFSPIFTLNECGGFTCHLQTLYLLLLGKIEGLSKAYVDILEKNARQNPQNILYTAAARKYGREVPWMVSWRLYPTNRLPDSTDRCETWATQRDDFDKGLQPCDKNEVHSGADLIFVDWLLRKT